MSQRVSPLGLEDLAEVVAAQVLLDLVETAELLTRLGIPHAVIGGIAVGLQGHPRATKDVDFLVGEEAYARTQPFLVFREELNQVVRIGKVDLLAVPERYPVLRQYLATPRPGELSVLAAEALVLLKLAANRPQDRADVDALLKQGLAPEPVLDFLQVHAPDLVPRFAELAARVPRSGEP